MRKDTAHPRRRGVVLRDRPGAPRGLRRASRAGASWRQAAASGYPPSALCAANVTAFCAGNPPDGGEAAPADAGGGVHVTGRASPTRQRSDRRSDRCLELQPHHPGVSVPQTPKSRPGAAAPSAPKPITVVRPDSMPSAGGSGPAGGLQRGRRLASPREPGAGGSAGVSLSPSCRGGGDGLEIDRGRPGRRPWPPQPLAPIIPFMESSFRPRRTGSASAEEEPKECRKKGDAKPCPLCEEGRQQRHVHLDDMGIYGWFRPRCGRGETRLQPG